jgi:hypothetical protein
MRLRQSSNEVPEFALFSPLHRTRCGTFQFRQLFGVLPELLGCRTHRAPNTGNKVGLDAYAFGGIVARIGGEES